MPGKLVNFKSPNLIYNVDFDPDQNNNLMRLKSMYMPQSVSFSSSVRFSKLKHSQASGQEVYLIEYCYIHIY